MKKLKILYEDKYLLVVYKDYKLSSIKDNKYKENLYSQVYDYLHSKNQKVFIVHRLDYDTAGLIMFAKSEKIKLYFQNNWENVSRNYISVVHGKIKDSGIIESYLKENKNHYIFSTKNKNDLYAKTIYNKIDENEKYSLININIITGRKNQIRVHMKDNNTPIVGDKKYGIKDNSKNMMLLANKLEFIHPITKKKIIIDMGIPDYYLLTKKHS